MNDFLIPETFQIGAIYQASKMYLIDAAELGRFDAQRLVVLEKEWQAVFDELPDNDTGFCFGSAPQKFHGTNGYVTFVYSPKQQAFVLLRFHLNQSTTGGGNVIAIQESLRPHYPVHVPAGRRHIAIGAVAAASHSLTARPAREWPPCGDLANLALEPRRFSGAVHALLTDTLATYNALDMVAENHRKALDERFYNAVLESDARVTLELERLMQAQAKARYDVFRALRSTQIKFALFAALATLVSIWAAIATNHAPFALICTLLGGVFGLTSAIAWVRATGRIRNLRSLATRIGMLHPLTRVYNIMKF